MFRVTLLLALLAASAGLSAETRAATTIGSDLSADPDSACISVAGCTATSLANHDGRPVTAPFSGTVVRFRVKHLPTLPSKTYTLKVLSGSGALVGDLASFTLTRQIGPFHFDDFSPEGIDVVETRFRISAGQRIGIFAPAGVAFQGTTPGSVLAEHDGDHSSGAAPYTAYTNHEPLINADIEPDPAALPAAPRRPLSTGTPAGYTRPRIGRVTRARRAVRSLLRKALTVPIRCHAACSAVATLVRPRGSRSGRAVTVARGRRTSAAGRFALRVKVTRKGRRVLRGLRRDARLALRVRASDAWGSSARRQRLTVTRR